MSTGRALALVPRPRALVVTDAGPPIARRGPPAHTPTQPMLADAYQSSAGPGQAALGRLAPALGGTGASAGRRDGSDLAAPGGTVRPRCRHVGGGRGAEVGQGGRLDQRWAVALRQRVPGSPPRWPGRSGIWPSVTSPARWDGQAWCSGRGLGRGRAGWPPWVPAGRLQPGDGAGGAGSGLWPCSSTVDVRRWCPSRVHTRFASFSGLDVDQQVLPEPLRGWR